MRRFSFLCILRGGLVLAAVGLVVPARAAEAAEAPLWVPVAEPSGRAAAAPAKAQRRTVKAPAGRTFELNAGKLRGLLKRTMPEGFGPIGRTGTEIPLPLPDGTLQRFLLVESPILAPKLAARHPELRTYLLQGVDDPAAVGRADFTPAGFHACVSGRDGRFYIDPYWRDEATLHVSYARKDYYDPDKAAFDCIVERAGGVAALKAAQPGAAARSNGAELRTYRLAVAATGEYTAAVSASTPGTVDEALAAIVTTVNRVSAIFERDLAIRLQLVAEEEQLIFTDPATDGLTNSNGDRMLGENQLLLDRVVGSADYDIGHVFSTGGGGVASLGCVCAPGRKARGVTGRDDPVGDPYDVDFVAHEMGHQFGANHTFNGTTGSCADENREEGNAYEPGSGTTIMAYAGVCSPQDLALHSDDYFHGASCAEISDYVTTGDGGCAQRLATGNSVPVIAALPSYTIPANTPFALTASASDADGDTLSYCWEEFDSGPAQDPNTTPRDNGASAIFRSFDPTPSPTRLFPSLQYILANANVPPVTSGGLVTGEVLPDTNRTMTFLVTVRDNRAAGGGVADASTTVRSVKTDAGLTFGPFRISNLNGATTIAAGTAFDVAWSVANSNLAPVSCANVRILFSTDGGRTFPHVLAPSVPNSGSANVVIPNQAQYATTQGRLKVVALGNVFFDLNDADLTVTTTNTAPTFTVTGSVSATRGSAPVSQLVGTAAAPTGKTPLTLSVLDAPGDVVLTPSIDGSGQVFLSAQVGCSVVTTLTGRTYPVTVVVTDSVGSTTARSVNLIVEPNSAPTLGTYGDLTVAPGTTAQAVPSAAPSDPDANLVLSSVAVAPGTLPGGGTLTVDQQTGVVTVSTQSTTTVGVVAARVSALDACGAAIVRSFAVNCLPVQPLPVAGVLTAPTAESAQPPNGAAEPGETVTFDFPIRNGGGSATGDLVATLRSGGGIAEPSAPRSYGAIAPQGTVSRAFSFRAGGSCGQTLTAVLELRDGAVTYPPLEFRFRLGAIGTATLGAENFDSVTPPALPVGWSAERIPSGTGGWRTSATSLGTAPNSAFATPSASAVLDQRLTSPSWTIPADAETVRLGFTHRWRTEEGYDGGILELSVDGGVFQDIVQAGGRFLGGGYNLVLDAGFGNPLGSVPAWTGLNGATNTNTVVELPTSVTGHSVRLRWRLGNDESDSVSTAYWRIDSVALSMDRRLCGSAPQIVSAVPPPAAVLGVPFHHQFSASGSPAPVFVLSAGTLPMGLTLAADGTLSGTPVQAGTGVFTGLVVTAQNGLAPAATLGFSLGIVTRLEPYLAGFGLTGAAAGATADPDGDGLGNLLEYALGTSPTGYSANPVPIAVREYGGRRYLSLEFVRSSLATDLTYIVEATGDLAAATWQELARSEGGGVTTGPGFVAEVGSAPIFGVEVRDLVAVAEASPPRRFIRLRVVGP